MKIVKKILNVIFYIIIIINILLLIMAIIDKESTVSIILGFFLFSCILLKKLIQILTKEIKKQIIYNKTNKQKLNYQKTPEQIQYELDGYKIVSTMIINNDSRKSASSSISRAVVGGAVLGLPGLIGGAVSGKNKNTTTFLIQYANGHKETKTVKNDSREFKEYCNYLI